MTFKKNFIFLLSTLPDIKILWKLIIHRCKCLTKVKREKCHQKHAFQILQSLWGPHSPKKKQLANLQDFFQAMYTISQFSVNFRFLLLSNEKWFWPLGKTIKYINVYSYVKQCSKYCRIRKICFFSRNSRISRGWIFSGNFNEIDAIIYKQSVSSMNFKSVLDHYYSTRQFMAFPVCIRKDHFVVESTIFGRSLKALFKWSFDLFFQLLPMELHTLLIISYLSHRLSNPCINLNLTFLVHKLSIKANMDNVSKEKAHWLPFEVGKSVPYHFFRIFKGKYRMLQAPVSLHEI